MRYLRTNTAVRFTVGPFFDKTDGVTPKTALTVTNCKLTFMVDDANVPTLVLDTNPTASGGANDMVHVTGDDAGFYDLELAAANVNYLGRAMIALTDAANHCPVFHEFMILPAVVYDAMILGTDLFDVSVTQILGTAVSTPATAGILDVNVKNIDNDAASASGTVTFPNATLASTTNITVATGVDVTKWLGTTVSTPTVAGVPNVNTKTWNDLATVALPLIPTTAGRTLDVSAGGEAGLDWANIGSPTTTVALTGTTIAVTQKVDVDTIKTNPVVNAGTITFPTTATLASTTNITAGTIATVTNLTNAPTSGDLTSTMKTSVSTAVWSAARSSFVTAGTFGQANQLVRDGTAQAGAATTITLDASASSTDDFYNNCLIEIIGGTGIGQARIITDYVGSTKVATVSTWITNPSNTSVFAIMFCDILADSGPTAAQVATAVWQDTTSGDFTVSSSIGKSLFTSGAVPGATGGLFIAGTNAATTITTSLTTTFTGNVTGSVASVASGGITAASIADGAIDRATFAADTGLQTVRSNTAQAGASGTITLDASASATTDFYKGDTIFLTGGTGVGQYRLCTAYNGSTKVATITPAWATNPASDSTFAVMPRGMVDAQAWLGGVISTPTVAGVPNVNAKTWNDLATVALPLIPTTAGRTLDVSATGEAGVDWANVGSPTTTLALTGTTIATTQKVDIETIKTNAVVNSGTVIFPTGATLASTTNITAGTITTVTNLTNSPTNGDLTSTMKASVSTAVWDAAKTSYVVAGSFGQGLQDVRNGTAQAGASTTITLDSSASASNSFYNNCLVEIIGGTGAGQSRFITGYVGSTKVATVNSAWVTNPDNTSIFLVKYFDSIPGATAPTAAQVATAVWQDTTAGDFTTSGSIGKSLFTSGVVPGAAGGLFIAGSNAATTVNITGSLSGSVGSVTSSVIISAGTGTGQLDFTSGVVKTNVTQLLGAAWLTPGTAGTPDVNVKLWNNLTTVALPLVPTAAGRTLDVSATGEAGVDWANVGSPTTTLALTGTTIATTQKVDVETIKTNPVVNAGTITFPTTATLASTTNITAGTITTATNLTNAATAGDFTSTMKTSLNAATPAVTVSSGGITASSLATDCITSAQLATSAVTEIQTGLSNHSAADVWAVATRTLTAGTNIQLPSNGLANVSAWTVNVTGNLSGSVGSVASGGITSGSFGAGAITASVLATDCIGAAQIAADAIGSSELATSAISEIQTGLSTLDGAAIRTAIGLASANLDTRLTAIGDYIDTEVAAIKAKTDAIIVTAGRVVSDMTAIAGSATAATNQSNAAQVIYSGSVTATSSTTTIVDSALTQTATGHFNGRVVIMLSGALKYQSAIISNFTPSTDTLTLASFTTAPAISDTYVIL